MIVFDGSGAAAAPVNEARGCGRAANSSRRDLSSAIPSRSAPLQVRPRAGAVVATPCRDDLLVSAYSPGAIIVSGRTAASNASAVTKPSLRASSRRVVPFLCAVFATVVALS